MLGTVSIVYYQRVMERVKRIIRVFQNVMPYHDLSRMKFHSPLFLTETVTRCNLVHCDVYLLHYGAIGKSSPSKCHDPSTRRPVRPGTGGKAKDERESGSCGLDRGRASIEGGGKRALFRFGRKTGGDVQPEGAKAAERRARANDVRHLIRSHASMFVVMNAKDSVDESSRRAARPSFPAARRPQDHGRRPLQAQALARVRAGSARRALVQGFRFV